MTLGFDPFPDGAASPLPVICQAGRTDGFWNSFPEGIHSPAAQRRKGRSLEKTVDMTGVRPRYRRSGSRDAFRTRARVRPGAGRERRAAVDNPRQAMVRLSRESEKRDGLNVLSADKRELTLTLTTPQPLRKPRSAVQTRRMEELRRDVRRQISSQLDDAARRVFRGHVAVEMRLALPADRHRAGLATVVKDYLDVLKGIVIFDDATVDHLLVLREPPVTRGTEVMLRCLPLRLFAADYDRFFRVLPEHEDVRGGPPAPPPPRGVGPRDRAWGHAHFDSHDREILRGYDSDLWRIEDLDAEEAFQLAEDPDADVDLDLPAGDWELADPRVRAYHRRQLEIQVALARGDWLTDQGFDARDRAGPPPTWLDETRKLDAADVVELTDNALGCLVLPPPPEHPTSRGQAHWPDVVAHEFAKLPSGGNLHGPVARFRGPVALDIAMRGGAGQLGDVDNLAGHVVRAFAKSFEQGHPVVAGYRVYRQAWPTADVRVRLLPAPRLTALADGMDRARTLLRAERAERLRA
jgi:hypothetical protein